MSGEAAQGPASPRPAPRRRRSRVRRLTQVSLAGLLTLVVGVAAILAGRNWLIRPYIVQAEAEGALLELGARLESEPGTPAGLTWLVGAGRFHRVRAANLEHSQTTDEDLIHLHRLPWLERLYLADSRVTDAGLVRVGHCEKLRRISLWSNPGVTDRGLVSLERLGRLEALDLGNTNVTDAGLASLARLPRLAFLKLPETVTGDGLAHLAGHPSLVELNLIRSGVRDRGAVHLAALPALRKLTVSPYLTDRTMVELARCSALDQLDLGENRRITPDGLTQLREDQLRRLADRRPDSGGAVYGPAHNVAVLRQRRLGGEILLDGFAMTQEQFDRVVRRPDMTGVVLTTRSEESLTLDLTSPVPVSLRVTGAYAVFRPYRGWNRPTGEQVRHHHDGTEDITQVSPSGNTVRPAVVTRTAPDRPLIYERLLFDAEAAEIALRERTTDLHLVYCEITAGAIERIAAAGTIDELALIRCVWADDVPPVDPADADRLAGHALRPGERPIPRRLPPFPALVGVRTIGPAALAQAIDLSRVARLHFATIEAGDGYELGDVADLKRFRFTEHLNWISLAGPLRGQGTRPVEPSPLECFAAAKELRLLTMDCYAATSVDVSAIERRLPRLMGLAVDGVNLDRFDVDRLARLPGMRWLTVGGADLGDDADPPRHTNEHGLAVEIIHRSRN